MRPDDELLDVVDRRRRVARDLPGWRSGVGRLLTILQCATRLRAMEIDRGIQTDVPWESVLAQIITWHHDVPIGEGPCEEKAALDICAAALEAARLDNLFGTIRAGGYEGRRRGEMSADVSGAAVRPEERLWVVTSFRSSVGCRDG